MANRVVQNVIIVDSAMGNSTILEGADYRSIWVNAIKLSMTDTSASLLLTDVDTSNVLVQLDKNEPLIHFANPQSFNLLKAPVVTNGTAWIYLA